jgi:hypothetical protein
MKQEYWMQTIGQGVFSFTSPENSTRITPYVIAHSLARTPRFRGHSRHAWFVSEHSLLVAHIGDCLLRSSTERALARPYLLLHDAHEAILGDMVAPLKRYIRDYKGFDFADLELQVDLKVRDDFGLFRHPPSWVLSLVKEADLYALKMERDLFMMSKHEWVVDVDVKLPAEVTTPEILPSSFNSRRRKFKDTIESALRVFPDAPTTA